MGIFVEIEGMGRVAEFPDGTLDDVINEAIQRDFFGGQGGKMGETPEPAPAAPATPPANSGAYNPEALFQRIGGFGFGVEA